MIKVTKKLAFVAVLSSVLSSGAVGEESKGTPDAEVFISGQNFSAVLRAGNGGGRLSYKGDDYAFQLSGGGFGIAGGISSSKATGKVYNLKHVYDFPGKYEGTSAGLAAVAGGGTAEYKNDKGVILDLSIQKLGAEVNLSKGSLTIEVAESDMKRMREQDAALNKK